MAYGRPGVYINETSFNGVPVVSTNTPNAAGAALGVFSKGPTALTLVTSWYDFTKKFGGFDPKYPATFGINQYFLNGGSELYVKRVTPSGADYAQVVLASTTAGVNIGTIKANDFGSSGLNLRVQITSKTVNSVITYTLNVYQEVVAQYLGTANIDVTNDLLVESFDNLVFSTTTDPNYAVTIVNGLSKYINLTLTDWTHPPTTNVLPLTKPTGVTNLDGGAATSDNYASLVKTDGTSDFDQVDRPLVIFAPEVYAKFVADGNINAALDTGSVHDALISWSKSGDGFAVIDTPPSLATSDAVIYANTRTAGVYSASSQAAMYYPNLYITDPMNPSRGILRKIGPAGSVAGVYMQTDKAVGPFKAPAGLQAGLRGVVSLERTFTSGDLDTLNSNAAPLNAIRNVRGAGLVIMGARTLLQDGTSNRYVNMRRSLLFIKKNLRDLSRFAVFQNNNSTLWKQINTALTVFLNEYRNKGGLSGATPAQSFYVKIDSENNNATTIAAGQVNIEVGVALQYPSEFVVINLSQIVGQ